MEWIDMTEQQKNHVFGVNSRKRIVTFLSGIVLFTGLPCLGYAAVQQNSTNPDYSGKVLATEKKPETLTLSERVRLLIASKKSADVDLNAVIAGIQVDIVEEREVQAREGFSKILKVDREALTPEQVLARGTLALLMDDSELGTSDLAFLAGAAADQNICGPGISRQALDRLTGFYIAHDNNDEALKCFQRFAEARPDNPIGFLGRGKILMQDGDAAGALADFRRALKLAPYSLAAFQGINEASEALEEQPLSDDEFRKGASEAMKDWSKLIVNTGGPNGADPDSLLDIFEFLDKKSDAVSASRELFQMGSLNRRVVLNVADDYITNGKHATALETLEKLSSQTDGYPEILRKKAALCLRLGYYSKGIELMDELAGLEKLGKRDKYLLGTLEFNIGDFVAARENLTLAFSGEDSIREAGPILEQLLRRSLKRVRVKYNGEGDSDEFSRSIFEVSMDNIDLGHSFRAAIGMRSTRLTRDMDLDDWTVLMNATPDGIALNSAASLPVSVDFQRFMSLHNLSYSEMSGSGLDITVERNLRDNLKAFGAHSLDTFGGETDTQDGYKLGFEMGRKCRTAVYYSRRPHVETQLGAAFAFYWEGFGINLEASPNSRLKIHGDYEQGDIRSDKKIFDVTLADNSRTTYSFAAEYQLLKRPGLYVGFFADKQKSGYTPDLNSMMNISYVNIAPYNGVRLDVNPFLPLYYSPQDLGRTGLGIEYRNSSRPRLNYNLGFKVWDCSDGDLEKLYSAGFEYAMNNHSDIYFEYTKHRKDRGFFTSDVFEADQARMVYESRF
ncbi:MAG: hypothetical protein CVV64_05890 [Candidatus Wallbacteria bacterium HGW-Wallbacteria-1]|jgi:tetratricopeptide (TPR) repeat protein|uniref:Uncharacterized protein n=1 Tax=Candidatus Wallbacteria bacterium HGW-Wallbacteria-1 TaxID=2013854 RepID=A0A2N1PSI3_9BACT|nr:MAG: hypothetical protein CVV64_05890 [Candidatus Wallbacteria bacterium HGW-Wallbacteria-1]